MSTEIRVVQNSGSRGVDLTITRYSGGKERGTCLQLSARMEDGNTGYVQLNTEDIKVLFSLLTLGRI